ncbi:hypothetical protein E5161_20510 [Cohnella pontilimi]|uniref:Lipoprotein n=1 Tax=Cohnella pontilimi TaxID=2564100 RepID=A0A4U0F0C9_9BACL|nr:hypothetical protein [Cohnella pontilimi]TJY37670.1 hypothetical protein E5161_20510 [Cohnella pontilimi]
MKDIRKSAVVILLAFVVMTVLAACQGKQDDSPAPTSTASTPASSSDSEVIKEGTIKKDDNVILKELSFVYMDHNIALSDIVDDDKLEGMLGKAEEKKSHTYSANDGTNMDPLIGFTENQYNFPGLVIKTINASEDKKFFIFSIEITSSKFATVRNIKVGDSVEKLKEAYPEGYLIGNGAPEEEDVFRYEPVNYVDFMNFHIKDAKIESIRISTLLY